MHEIELKFQVPPAQSAALRRRLATASAVVTRLQARYFDTPDRRLANAGLALRLRREGAHWVQTLKGHGDGLLYRLEHEVPLAPARSQPELELARHDGTAVGSVLAQALGDTAGTLTEVYTTDVRRTQRVLRLAGGTRIEVAFDEGRIAAGGTSLRVCELEFELKRGEPAALPALASVWVARHGLWLDPRSKSERGDRLARGVTAVPATRFTAPALRRGMYGEQALRAALGGALRQVLANACELAEGGLPEHLHQCRVGLRRLRCTLRDFAPLAGETVPPAFADWSAALEALFRRLGDARDRDALRASLWPALRAAGAPAFDPFAASADAQDVGALLRAADCNRLWLDMLAWLQPPQALDATVPTPPAEHSLTHQVRARLRKLHRQLAADAARFGTLDETAQHRVRKRLKRLRYGLESFGALFPERDLRRRQARLAAAQDALGRYNDLLVARRLFEAQVQAHPQAWFALGWIASQREAAVAACTAALVSLAALRKP